MEGFGAPTLSLVYGGFAYAGYDNEDHLPALRAKSYRSSLRAPLNYGAPANVVLSGSANHANNSRLAAHSQTHGRRRLMNFAAHGLTQRR